MIRREFDATRINTVVNDPSVHPWVCLPGQGVLDLSPVVGDPRNVLLMADRGGLLFVQHEPGVYEVHTQFVKEVRGRAVVEATRAAVHWMFTKTDCMEVLTKVPQGNVAAEALTRLVGGVLDFERSNAWPSDKGQRAVKFYGLRYADWVRSARALEERGHWFHERLESEKARLGSAAVIHDDDPAHDRHVGAAVEMILSGQVAKAIVLYNRWARFAGYAELRVVSASPVIIDIQEALIAVNGDNFEVIKCQ